MAGDTKRLPDGVRQATSRPIDADIDCWNDSHSPNVPRISGDHERVTIHKGYERREHPIHKEAGAESGTTKGNFLMLTPEYSRRTTGLGRRLIEIGPKAASEALEKLGVSEDKIHIIQAWDREFHQDLVRLWNPPPATDDDVKKINHQVTVLRRALDEKEIELLGVETANRFNVLHSKIITRMLNSDNSASSTGIDEPIN
jgi:hypothetical protein